MGKVIFLQLGNRVLETLAFPMKMQSQYELQSQFRIIFAGKANVSRTRFPDLGNISIPIGKLLFLQIGNRVLETLSFTIKMRREFAKSLDSAPFSLGKQTFSEHDFRTSEILVFPWEN